MRYDELTVQLPTPQRMQPVTPAWINSEEFQKICDTITAECSKWLHECDFKPVFRGTKLSDDILTLRTYRSDRRPLGSRAIQHIAMDQAFASLGFKANRSNSIFCSGDRAITVSYGKTHLVFCRDPYYYTWSPNISDALGASELKQGFGHKPKIKRVEPFVNSYKDYQQNAVYHGLRNHVRFLSTLPNLPDNALKWLQLQSSMKYEEDWRWLDTADYGKILKEILNYLKQDPEYNKLRWEILRDYRNKLNSLIVSNSNWTDEDITILKSRMKNAIGNNYKNTDLVDAINSNNEIMVTGESYYLLALEKLYEKFNLDVWFDQSDKIMQVLRLKCGM